MVERIKDSQAGNSQTSVVNGSDLNAGKIGSVFGSDNVIDYRTQIFNPYMEKEGLTYGKATNVSEDSF